MLCLFQSAKTHTKSLKLTLQTGNALQCLKLGAGPLLKQRLFLSRWRPMSPDGKGPSVSSPWAVQGSAGYTLHILNVLCLPLSLTFKSRWFKLDPATLPPKRQSLQTGRDVPLLAQTGVPSLHGHVRVPRISNRYCLETSRTAVPGLSLFTCQMGQGQDDFSGLFQPRSSGCHVRPC